LRQAGDGAQGWKNPQQCCPHSYDATAIAEAVTCPTMRFVELKRPDQVDLYALHRIRYEMVGNRTRLICQMRPFCLEHGVAIRQGAGLFKLDLLIFNTFDDAHVAHCRIA
jgi:transposase